MTGRLGMIGPSLGRGDKAFGVAEFGKGLTPEEIQERIAASNARKRTPAQQAAHQSAAAAAKTVPAATKKTKVPLKLLMPTRRQYGNWAADVAVMGGGAYALRHNRRKNVSKADDNRRRNRTVAGGAVGLGATDLGLNVGGWANREGIKHHERKVDAGILPHSTTRSQRGNILSAHRAKHGVKGDIHDAGNAYYRDFPKGMPAWKRKRLVGFKNHPGAVAGMLTAGTVAGAVIGARHKQPVAKAATTMSDREAHRLSAKYDTRGPLPKGMDRETKMKAYEARYIATGGKKAEKWKRHADMAERGRNVGLAGATAAGATLLAGKSRRLTRLAHKTPGIRHVRQAHVEGVGLASGVGGGASELYGEHARKRRASYQNSPGGVAASALSRMRAYTPTKPGAPT